MEAKIVLTTCPAGDLAEEIAVKLVDEKAAACVNIIPGVLSCYRWKGRIERENESLLIIKTAGNNLETLRRKLEKLHPYEVPEFVVLDVEALSESYGAWLSESLGL